jgi:hypothetical protein
VADAAPLSTVSDGDWARLISRIKDGQCTPFLGAGMSSERIPLGSQIAEKMALDPLFDYPLPDKHDLIKVSQYIAPTIDGSTPKEIVAKIIKDAGYPDFQKPDEPHMALAELPLPLYITTNYDDFMFQALKRTGRNDPQLFINRFRQQQARGSRRRRLGDPLGYCNPHAVWTPDKTRRGVNANGRCFFAGRSPARGRGLQSEKYSCV